MLFLGELGYWAIQFFIDYVIFIFSDFFAKLALRSARNEKERHWVWLIQSGVITVICFLLHYWLQQIHVFLFTSAVCCFLASQQINVLSVVQCSFQLIEAFLYYGKIFCLEWIPWIGHGLEYIHWFIIATFHSIQQKKSSKFDVQQSSSIIEKSSEQRSTNYSNATNPVVISPPDRFHASQSNMLRVYQQAGQEINPRPPCPMGGGRRRLKGSRQNLKSSEVYEEPSNHIYQVTPTEQPLNFDVVPSQANFKDRFVNYIKSTLSTSSYKPRGLHNDGHNLCFMNAVLQCLARTPYFTSELANALGTLEFNPECCLRAEWPLAKIVSSLLSELELNDGDISSQVKFREVASQLNNVIFAAPVQNCCQLQQDAAEFTMWLLGALHTALNCRSPNDFICSTLTLEEIAQRADLARQDIKSEIAQASSLDDPQLLQPLQCLAELEWMLYSKHNDSLVDYKFTGQLAELRQCLSCHRISVSIENFNMLPIVVPELKKNNRISLETLFQNFHKIEYLQGSSSLHCECSRPITSTPELRNKITTSQNRLDSPDFQKFPVMSPIEANHVSYNMEDPARASPNALQSRLTEGKKRTILCRLPECLIVQLMRFRYDRERQQGHKIYTAVKINKSNLDLTALSLESMIASNKLPTDDSLPHRKFVYDMHGLCLHLGGENTTYGHYISYGPDKSGTWYRLEDEDVTYAWIDYELDSETICENAYLLFYHLQR